LEARKTCLLVKNKFVKSLNLKETLAITYKQTNQMITLYMKTQNQKYLLLPLAQKRKIYKFYLNNREYKHCLCEINGLQ
jgi:hypothetical protein